MITYSLKTPKTIEQALSNLYEIISLLRSENGCPWDREQTPKDVSGAIIDETFEYLDAILKKDIQHCSEEIGDVLLNVMMALRIHQEYDDFSPVSSIHSVCEKLIRRHPHVFSDAEAADSTEVLSLWNEVKRTVEGRTVDENNIFRKIPSSLPELLHAYEIQKSLKKVGFEWPDISGVVDKIREEFDEVTGALDDSKDHLEEEIGDLLFSVVNLSRYVHVNPVVALRRSNNKVMNRFNIVSDLAKERGIPFDMDHADALNVLWEEAKKME
ncbi:MAG: nucleoside triphosphate pyrophosphohydrolase [Spirochaetaceae bacterium JB067]